MQNDFARYSCQVNLPGFGEAAQQALQQAKVLMVGMGGLGCPTAQYLTSSGIGTIGIVDHDTISVSNLHRQILYNADEVGQKKVTVAAEKLSKQNPTVNVISHDIYITADNVIALIRQYDVIVDCTDNFETKYLLNDACVLNGKPLVFGAIYQYEGQVAVFNTKNIDGTMSINYRDIFPEVNAAQIPNCAEGGIIPTLAGIIGCIQANEVIKYLTNTGELLSGKMLILDALTMQSSIIKTGTVTKTNIRSLAPRAVISSISLSELQEKLTHESIELIDVRTPKEHASYNIGGKNIPVTELETQLQNIDPTRQIIFYCATGKRSAEAVKQLLTAYPKANAVSIQNGIGNTH